MKLKNALDDKKLDLRLRDRLVAEGKLTKEEVSDYLKKLVDDQKNAAELFPQPANIEHKIQ